jgi:hypothetical protein
MPIEKILTPVGRIVWGNPAKAQIKRDQNTNQPVLREGKQIEQWSFGLAIPKPEFNQFLWPLFQQEAASIFPQGVPGKFSWKLKDGDGVDSKGQPYRNREGYAGCWILTISTEAFAPQIFKFENNAYRQITENEIKTGDYVRAAITIKANAPTNQTHTPGLYVNPNGIEFVGYGAEIVTSGADPDDLFKGQQAQLPPGASAVPISTMPAGMPGQPMPGGMPGQQPPMQTGYVQTAPQGQPYPQQQPGAYVQPQAGPVATPTNLPQPDHTFVANAGNPYPQQQPGGYAPNVATGPQPGQPQPGMQYAPSATSYPSNGMPGQPMPR